MMPCTWSGPPVTVRERAFYPARAPWLRWENSPGDEAGRSDMRSRRLLSLLVLCVLLAAAGCGGGGDDGGGDSGDKSITFWLAEDVAQRVNLIKQITDRFQPQSGVQVKVVAIA